MTSTSSSTSPNIVLIMTDQQRWDALGCAGVFPVETPALDRLAREGVWFRRAYCNGPLCVPSRMSLLSGRYVHQHGCRDNAKSLWPEAPSFVRALQTAGYFTANIGKLHYTWQHDLEILASQPLLKRMGFADPCETTGKMSAGNLRASPYSEHLRELGLLEDYHRDLLRRVAAGPIHAYDTRPSMLDEENHIDGWLLRRAADWIGANDHTPFFLWIGPPGPHDPFDPPGQYASRYAPEDMPLGPLDMSPASDANARALRDATPRQIQEMRTQYFGNVTFIDDGVRRVIEALEARGQLADTWIIITTDHGEMLGDHRLLHKSQFYEQAVRVPVIIRPSSTTSASHGIVSGALVELLDVSATILDIAGAALPGQQGRSLLPIVRGEASLEHHRDMVVSELGDRLMLYTGEWKLVVRGDELQPQSMWNLLNDPQELRDLAGEPALANVLATLLEQIHAFLAATPADLPAPWQHLVPYPLWSRNPLREPETVHSGVAAASHERRWYPSRADNFPAGPRFGWARALASPLSSPRVAVERGSVETPATATAVPGSRAITIPNTGAVLPTEKVSFHWIDSGGLKQTFMQLFVPLYEKAHPNITVQYDALPWNEIAKTVPLGVQNGNAPDVFQVPQNFTGGQAVAQGWIQPLDAIVPNFAQWKAAFPPGTFYEGITVYNGKTYSFPFWSNKTGDLLLYNADYLSQAGIDPQAHPLGWDEYRASAKKLTQQGRGKYYGVIIEGNQADRWAANVRAFAQPAGAIGASGGGSIQDMNLKTGEYNLATDQYLAAIDLLLALKMDGSVFPGSLSLNGPQARAQMAQGVAGMILQGPFNIPQWKSENADFHFGVARTPVPNSGAPAPQMYTPGGGEFFWVYAKSEYPAIAGDIFAYLGSEAGQTAALSITGGARQSVFAQANAAAQLDPRAKQANDIFDQTLHLGPDPNVRNPDWAQVELERKTVTPDFGTTIQGIYTGQISDAKQAMHDLKDRTDKELDRAIKAAQAKGAKVSRDDLVFANWDPTRDYTDGDYAALKK